jgi:cytochrome c-type biogenesis protein CcmH/NrfG
MSDKCVKCGTPVPHKAKYCPECGAEHKVKNGSEIKLNNSESEKSNSTLLKGYQIIYLVTIISLIVVGFYSYKFIVPNNNINPHNHGENFSGEQQTILNDLKKAIDLNPGGFQENVDLGNFLFDSQRYDEALIYYLAALKTNPQSSDVLVDVGVCHFNMQQYDQARDYFKKALDIDGKHQNALYNFGVVSAKLDDMPAMREAWEKLIEVAPESDPARAAKQMLEEIKNSSPGSN